MSRLARLSLANRSLIALASFAIVAFGVVSMLSTKLELFPSLTLPQATITAAYPGASPEIVEREVTEPIEAAIAGVDGLEARTSTSASGIAMIQAEFDYGTDSRQAVQDLQQAINRVSGQLPDDVDPQVRAGSTDSFPVIMLAAGSDLDERTLAQRLDTRVVPEISAIPGVQDVQVTGARTQRVMVDLDPDKLADRGLTSAMVGQALQANGVSVPGGQFTRGDRTLAVEIGAPFDSVKDVVDLELVPGPSASPSASSSAGSSTRPPAGSAARSAAPVKLSDVGTVKSELAPSTTLTRTNGKPTLGIMVTKTGDGNTVTVSNDVKDKISDLQTALGGNAKLTVIFDQAPFIESSVEGLTTEGGIGLLFAVVVILVFLLSIRSTLVTALSIPFSLLVAIIGLYAGGYSFNILTLGALTVAIGRVVDDSIVVLENIKRHLGYGEDKRRAILEGVREVAGAVTASTLTTVGVFLPIAFVGGQVGQLFQPFAVTVSIALLASLLVSLTLMPVLAYWFLKPSAASPSERERVRQAALDKERRSPLQRTYVPVIRWATRHRVTTILAGIAVFAGTIALVPMLQTNFLSGSGQNTFSVTQTLPVATSLESTDEAAQKVERVLADLDGVTSYQVTVGGGGFNFGPGGGVSGSNEATFSVTTDENADQAAIEKRLRDGLDALTGAGELTVSTAEGFGSSDLEVIVHAPDSSTLREAARRVEQAVRDTPGTTDVRNNLAADMPTMRVNVDRAKAARAGLSEGQIGQAVRQAFEGQQVASVALASGQQDVVLREGSSPATLAAVRDLRLPTPAGSSVRIGDVATVSEVERAAQITRIDGERTASITATPTGSDTGGVSTTLQDRLADVELPAGATYSLGGVSQEQGDAFRQLLLAMLAAIAVVFMVLVATFRSIVQPLILLVSIPFAATGALGLLLVTDTPLGVPGLIGMLMLVGIVVTNAIVLIDLINQYREQGMSVRDAVIEGGRRRLRPILMTAIATICALIPMALGLTGGGVFISQPLAIVVIGGLVTSTLLTLVLVPTLYTMVEGRKERRRQRREARRPIGSGADAPTNAVEPSAATADTAPAPTSGVAAAPASTEVAAPAVVTAPEAAAAGHAAAGNGGARHLATMTLAPAEQANGAPASSTVRVGVLQVEVVVRTAGTDDSKAT
ncbi:efflux RND transporter permease subunit [Actinopolymorpha alba]|uniref:efflux RND transporter permease subunit n=1 Tax=Actinopolymorpha alba TaxID=533267 RepID=UPI00037C0283|nr:efflux RND transporter permease subunit [Actinopolymorpha alba]